jgi:hypothetical protein
MLMGLLGHAVPSSPRCLQGTYSVNLRTVCQSATGEHDHPIVPEPDITFDLGRQTILDGFQTRLAAGG